MHPDWQEFLLQQGALIEHGQVTRAGHDPALAGPNGQTPSLVNLSDIEGWIDVTGPERREFLQGQLSTDIRRLSAQTMQLSAWNNVKGRVVATLRVSEQDDAVQLVASRDMLATVLAGLRRYVLRSKVTLTDASDRLAGLGLVGIEAPRLLADCEYPAPESNRCVRFADGIQVARLRGALPRYAVYGEVAALRTLWTRLRQLGARPTDNSLWTLQRILARVPCIHPATSGQFVAQMLGLEDLDAIHFNKGCYLGQEVIARAHYRGTVKRHLYRASGASDTPILPGADIIDTTRSIAVGKVVDACRDDNDLWQLLIVLPDESTSALLHIGDAPVTLIQ